MYNARSWVCVLARQLECCELATDVAVCGSLLWMVATSDALNCLNGSRAMVQWNGRRGALLPRGSAFAIGACHMATIPARSELERPRDAYFEAVCACLHPHSDLLVSHGQDSGFVAYDAEWIFNTLLARARATNGRARTQKYCLERLRSLRVMDRSICSGFARNIDRF